MVLVNSLENDKRVILGAAAVMLALLLTTLWWDRYLPLQDYPQHLFMAELASNIDDPQLDWNENFESRAAFGPYRVAFFAQQALGVVTDTETAGKLLITLYLLLLALFAWLVYRSESASHPPWAVLLVFPLCFHAIYFYGFLSYVLSIPVLLLALFHLQWMMRRSISVSNCVLQCSLVISLFFFHPLTLLAFTGLASLVPLLVGRTRAQRIYGMAPALLGALLFLSWSSFGSGTEVVGSSVTAMTWESLNMKWWPAEWSFSFLAMMFTGMRYTTDPVVWVAVLWGLLMLPLGFGVWRGLKERSIKPLFGILALVVFLAYFILPFSLVLSNRYTFFGIRLAPIALFLLVPFFASLPIKRGLGRLLLVISLGLSVFSVQLHHRVAQELASAMPVFDKLAPNAAILPLYRGSPSAHLDRFFYNQFHSNFSLYGHILRGGGVNPDFFHFKVMPVAYREGHRPPRPPHREPYKWTSYAAQYDYVLAGNVPDEVRRQLELSGSAVGAAGPWTLYLLAR